MLVKTTYKDQVYQKLKKKILNGELEKEKLYSEQQFAELFQVSRTPVREALLQLKSEGYIEIIPNRGIKVIDYDLQSLYELCQMRDAIESYCAAELARRYHEEEIQKKVALIEQNVISTEEILTKHGAELTPEYYLNEVGPFFLEFNTLLISSVENRHFDSFQTMHAGRLNVLDVKTSFVQGRPLHAVQEHRKILMAIKNGDAETAGRECHNHVLNVFHAVEKIT